MEMEAEYSRLHDVEAILGVKLFDDPDRQQLAYSHPERLPDMQPGNISERRYVAVYTSNILLKMCIADRDTARDIATSGDTPFDEKTFNARWRPSEEQLEIARQTVPAAYAKHIVM